MRRISLLIGAALIAWAAVPARAQTAAVAGDGATASSGARPAARIAPPAKVRFEEPKQPVDRDLKGVQLELGAAFATEFQNLDHRNSAAPAVGADGKDANLLQEIGDGFNLAGANLYLKAKLAPGISVAMTSYLSSRHHSEAWVKDGYLQMDASPIELAALENLMKYLSVKVGHFEVNYGDAHFRRTDNGNALLNPFVENLILDGFATEVGGELHARKGPFLAMVGATNGLIKGDVTRPEERDYAFLAKLGVDRELSEAVRFRLTASTYRNDNAGSATLFGGDRAGSRYFNVLDNAAAKVFTNGRVNPDFTEEVYAYQVNPFVKLGGLELFGVLEWAEGRNLRQTSLRSVRQYAVDGVYRFLENRLYVAGRYNALWGELSAAGSEQNVNRVVASAGWFVTPNVLLKGEYVRQRYEDFPSTSILSGGEFDGLVLQAGVSF